MYGNITSAKCPWIIGHIAMYICRSGNIAERGYKQGGVILKIYFGPLLKCSSDLLGQRLTIPAYLIFVILFTDKILGSKILHPQYFFINQDDCHISFHIQYLYIGSPSSPRYQRTRYTTWHLCCWLWWWWWWCWWWWWWRCQWWWWWQPLPEKGV